MLLSGVVSNLGTSDDFFVRYMLECYQKFLKKIEAEGLCTRLLKLLPEKSIRKFILNAFYGQSAGGRMVTLVNFFHDYLIENNNMYWLSEKDLEAFKFFSSKFTKYFLDIHFTYLKNNFKLLESILKDFYQLNDNKFFFPFPCNIQVQFSEKCWTSNQKVKTLDDPR
jgi:hypothetical protein